MRKLLIDTDIGDDIDDALALTLAIKSGEFDLLGVTTVYRNAHLRAHMAKYLLTLAQREETPVYAGCGLPLAEEVNVDEKFCQYTSEIDNEAYRPLNDEDDSRGDGAVEFILNCAKEHGASLTIMMLGAHTNIAKSIQKDPEIMRGVGRYVMMGGCFYAPFPEWNIKCDPEAAKMVFDAGLRLCCVGTDVTLQCGFSQAEKETILNASGSSLEDYLARITKSWLEASGMQTPVPHDPLAVCAALNARFLSYGQGNVDVELAGEESRGITRFRDAAESGVLVAKEVDVAAFKRFFFTTLYSKA